MRSIKDSGGFRDGIETDGGGVVARVPAFSPIAPVPDVEYPGLPI
jgi:hypothetical protein